MPSSKPHDSYLARPGLPPGLCPSPIHAAVASRPRGLALAMSVLVWAGAAGASWWLALKAAQNLARHRTPTLAVRVQLAEPPDPEEILVRHPVLRAGDAPEAGGPVNLDYYSMDPRALPLPEAPRSTDFNLIYAPEVVNNPANRAGLTGVGPGLQSGGLGVGAGAANGSATGVPGRPGEGEVVPLKDVDMDDFVVPKYPGRAVDHNISGDVVVRVTIDEMGKIVQHEIHAGHPAFHEEVDKVMPRWRFRPVRRKGKPVRATFEVVIRFKLMGA